MASPPRSETERRRRLEDQLRLKMFYSIYRRGQGKDPWTRFAEAIVASAAPIVDPDAMLAWCEQYGTVDEVPELVEV